MEHQAQIHEYVQTHRQEILSLLKEIIRIPSVGGDAEENAPFGRECARALEEIARIYASYGFETELDRQGGYLLSGFWGDEKCLGIFAHVDVVPVSDDWLYTKPFEPLEKENYLFGRGVMDDKSAVIISLFCARMIRELNLPFKSSLVLFTGSNEESGMKDIRNYLSAHRPVDFALVADTGFPLYRGNKGALGFEAVSTVPMADILEFSGGKPGTIVGQAKARIAFSEQAWEYLQSNGTELIRIVREEQTILLLAQGIAKHTALPSGSLNAGSLLAKVLCDCPALLKDTREQLAFVAGLLQYYYGESVGVDNDDPEFGKLTFANDEIRLNNDGCLWLHFNMRMGAAVDQENLKQKLAAQFAQQGWKVCFTRQSPAHILPLEHPLVQGCLQTYREYTGDGEGEALVNAGGTYAVHLPCAIETGPTLIWGNPFDLPAGHGGAHQPDEVISIEGFLGALELTLLMLLECDRRLHP